MTLKNDFYTITARRESGFDVRLNAEHFIYKAHFPGEPITPGVCIVQMAAELLGEHLGRTVSVRGLKNVKFLAVIAPDETPGLSVDFSRIATDEEAATVSATATVSAADGVKAKVSLVCSPAPLP